MSEIIQKDGVDVEVFTADEIEAQKQEALEKYKEEHPDKGEELSRLQEKLSEAEEKLAGEAGKDKNLSALRKAKEDAEKKLEDFSKSIDEKIGKVKHEVLEGVMKDHYNETLKALAGDDEELKKKIEFNYKRLGDTAATKAEMNTKLQDAWRLSTTPEEQNALNSTVLSSGGMGKIKVKSSDKKFSPEEKALAQKMAAAGGLKLEDKDFN